MGFTHVIWRQLWRVAGRESDFPGASGNSLNSQGFSHDFPGSSPATCPELLFLWKEQSRGSPDFFTFLEVPGLPWKLPGPLRCQPLSLGSLTPSNDSQKLPLSRVAQEPNRNRKPEPSEPFKTETESGTGTAGTVFQEPEPEPSFPVQLY